MVRSKIGSWNELGRRLRRVFGAVAGACALAVVALPACSDEEAKPCEGVQTPTGCEKKCDESACAVAGMKCVRNACSASCTDPVKDCPAGKYCYGTTADDGTQGQYCDWAEFTQSGKYLGQYDTQCTEDKSCDGLRGFKCLGGTCKLTGCKSNADCAAVPGVCVKDPSGDATKNYCEKGAKPLDLGEKCTKSLECDADQSLGCVNGECMYVNCATHADCAKVGLCQSAKNAEGKDVLACLKGTTYPPGQFGTKCPEGSAGTECDAANNFVCVGAGPGDIDAYCTKTGCLADSDCGEGYFCSASRTSKKPCTDACGITGAAGSGCVAASDIGPGKEYSCGAIGLLRNICLKRQFCNDCENDDDCRAKPNQLCASDGKGHKYCTTVCEPNVSNACGWGSAAECAVHDTALGKPTCAHKFGACAGTGKGCEPCRDDADCPTGLCLRSDYTGENYCLDLASSCSCTGYSTYKDTQCLDGGCPKTPGGINMVCYGGSAVPSSSLVKDKCFGSDVLQGTIWPYTKPGCWPE